MRKFNFLFKNLPINYQFAEEIKKKKYRKGIRQIPAVNKSYLKGGFILLNPSPKPISKIVLVNDIDE